MAPPAGALLTDLASRWGVYRRWWGLEPDRWLWDRLQGAMMNRVRSANLARWAHGKLGRARING